MTVPNQAGLRKKPEPATDKPHIAVGVEVVIDPPLCPVHAPKRRGKRPRTRAIEAGHLDRHKGKTHLRHERCLKTGGLAKERKLVPTPFQLLGKGKGWVDVAGCPPSRDGDFVFVLCFLLK